MHAEMRLAPGIGETPRLAPFVKVMWKRSTAGTCISSLSVLNRPVKGWSPCSTVTAVTWFLRKCRTSLRPRYSTLLLLSSNIHRTKPSGKGRAGEPQEFPRLLGDIPRFLHAGNRDGPGEQLLVLSVPTPLKVTVKCRVPLSAINGGPSVLLLLQVDIADFYSPSLSYQLLTVWRVDTKVLVSGSLAPSCFN
jgi:hypothetical protein